MSKRENRLVLAHIWVALGAMFVGTFFGLLQVYSRAGAHVTEFFDYYRHSHRAWRSACNRLHDVLHLRIATYATYSTIPRETGRSQSDGPAWSIMLLGTVMADGGHSCRQR